MSWLFKRPKDQAEKIRKDIKRLSKHVITIPHEGQEYKFYELSNIHDMPAKRYQIMNQFIEDARLNIQKEELKHYLTELDEYQNSNTPEGMTKANVLTRWLKTRVNISLDVDMVMRVLSSCILMEGEDPLDYDWDVNDFKIQLFEKYGVTTFFLNEPIKKYLSLITTSKIDIETILEQRSLQRVVTKELSGIGISVWSMYNNTSD